MSKIITSLHAILSTYPEQTLVIAYSGGIDSQVLLDAVSQLIRLKKITNRVIACHVNHGLSTNADDWEAFAIKECAQRSIELITTSVVIDQTRRDSIEAKAREARYNVLSTLVSSPAVILTGHHKDDQAETFLLALKRGAGVKGLGGIRAISSLGHHTLVRPLLDITRADIHTYATQHELSWIEDESNNDTHYDRNYVRNEIIPQLSTRWPSVVNTICRSAEHCQQSQELLDELAELDLNRCQQSLPYNAINVTVAAQLSKARLNNVFRYFLSLHQCLMPSTRHLAQIGQQMHAGHDQTPEILLGDKVLRRFNHALYLTENFTDVTHFEHIIDINSLNGLLASKETFQGQSITLPDGLGRLVIMSASLSTTPEMIDNQALVTEHMVSLPHDAQQLRITFSHDNPKVLPEYRSHHRSLKKVLQELHIAPWLRKRIPFIFIDDELALITGHAICQPFVPQHDANILRVFWLKFE